MRLFIISFLLLVGGYGFGQETKKVTIKNKNPKSQEEYYVLKSNKSVKHGSYKKYNYKNKLVFEGHFTNGVKDSIWEFYDYQGNLEQKYNYTNNEILYYKKDDTNDKEYKVINGNDTIHTKLDRPPLYIGGSSKMFESIIGIIHYPSNAKANGISGKVFIAFTIDKVGNTLNYRVVRSVNNECDEEALRVVKQIPVNWTAGILNGETVNVEYLVPINFILR